MLAGALVLGVGGATTVAAWVDQQYGRGVFEIGFLAVESTIANPYRADGPWAAAGSEPWPALGFAAGGLLPEDEAYAPIAVRVTAGSVAASMRLKGAVITGAPALGEALRYRVVRAPACGPEAFTAAADYVVGGPATSRPVTADQDGVDLRLDAGIPEQPGSPVHLCFEIALPRGADNSLQGQRAGLTWHVTTTSAVP